MSIQEVSAEQLAELFHHYHQALGPDFGCAAPSARESWDRVSRQEKNTPPYLSVTQNGRIAAKRLDWPARNLALLDYGTLEQRAPRQGWLEFDVNLLGHGAALA